MAETAANLVDYVLPPEVPLRQWVVTFPFQLRARLAFDAKLLSAVCGLVNDVLLGFYERAMRERAGSWQGEGKRKLQSGTVTVVQRVKDRRTHCNSAHPYIFAQHHHSVSRASRLRENRPDYQDLRALDGVRRNAGW